MKASFYFSMFLLAVPTVMSAQFKINSSGTATLCATITPQTPAKLTIGNEINTYSQARVGLSVNTMTTEQSTQNIGVNSVVDGTGPYNGISIGVRGLATGGYQDMNFGVLGSITGPVTYGAAILGAINNWDGISVNGRYAGYFVGPVRSTDNITATGFITPSDIRLKENIVSLSRGDTPKSHALNNILNMNVVEYNYKKLSDEHKDAGLSMERVSDNTAEEIRHFGLLAQELAEIYPNLVIEGQDKYLSVNYIELVPLLIRSIQELKQELDEMRISYRADARSSMATTSVNLALVTGNRLYQNTPNPFRDQTIIRFSLAEDVKDAYVCIFDMTGKTLKKISISSGMESISVDGYELGEGMFLYSLIVNRQVIDTKRMIISK